MTTMHEASKKVMLDLFGGNPLESLILLVNPFVSLSFLLICFIIMKLSVSLGNNYLKNNMGHGIGILLISTFILFIFSTTAPNLIYIVILKLAIIIYLTAKTYKSR
ncbi:hypothetical protein ACWA5Z_10015 [Testudinibacter sp. P80/BLE/0925]|uniref:hypothetical protein n=1 Tax=Testudinibacter sp. TW-1 TaxID=3417757 RepID=UPI003D36E57F